MNNEANISDLTATKNSDGWIVEDQDGGVWYPHPATTAIVAALPEEKQAKAMCLFCDETPMSGEWRS